jgi:hypothetical protein
MLVANTCRSGMEAQTSAYVALKLTRRRLTASRRPEAFFAAIAVMST